MVRRGSPGDAPGTEALHVLLRVPGGLQQLACDGAVVPPGDAVPALAADGRDAGRRRVALQLLLPDDRGVRVQDDGLQPRRPRAPAELFGPVEDPEDHLQGRRPVRDVAGGVHVPGDDQEDGTDTQIGFSCASAFLLVGER